MNPLFSFLKSGLATLPGKRVVALVFALGFSLTAIAQPVPTPTPVITSSKVPDDVAIPANFPGNPIAFFDDFSWRAFVALVWPGLQGQRGAPDPAQTVGGKGPRVFETYKALNEVFHNDGSAPAAWNDFDPATYNPCNAAMAWGDLTLGSISKFSDLGQAGFGNLTGPLIAQNTTYVRFLTAYNQVEFDQILGKSWYIRANLPQKPASITFDVGSVDVKSAWIDMTGVQHPDRYHTRTAAVMDPVYGTCSQKTVGLVGLHIVVKTPTRPQWIWSSFEQVDNVPPAQPGAPGPFGPGTFNFNDGKGGAMPASNPYALDRVLTAPTAAAFNVTRGKPIHQSTQSTNKAYQLALKGTVWQNYQLVTTQWPLKANSPTTPGTPQNTFPGTGATTAFANATLETFEQGSVFTSCMACHNSTMAPTDFLWSLNDHAFPANKETPNLMMNPAFRELRTIFEKEAQMQEKTEAPRLQQKKDSASIQPKKESVPREQKKDSPKDR